MANAPVKTDRLDVTKTYKLYIDGKFPRSESGRSLIVHDAKGRVAAHVCHASRKDLRDAVSAARKALDGWRGATAYLRGQILYRMAEMMEGKKGEFAAAIGGATTGRAAGGAASEVEAAIDRLVCFAGWADKYAQVLGCNNAVAGPYYNFTVPEPTGVVAVIAPDSPALLGLISLLAPVVCSGNTAVVLTGESDGARLSASVLGEVMATSDVPGGVVNILTGTRSELVPIIAGHRDIDAVHAAGGEGGGGVSAEESRVLREGAAENVKRVVIKGLATAGGKWKKGAVAGGNSGKVDWFDAAACGHPWMIEPFVEMKTVWHPSAV
jgi:acyl-CoA reductase-like NAD-dependent aldehyde dehydrogenase